MREFSFDGKTKLLYFSKQNLTRNAECRKIANWQRVKKLKKKTTSGGVSCSLKLVFVVIRGAENMMERIIGACAKRHFAVMMDFTTTTLRLRVIWAYFCRLPPRLDKRETSRR